MCAVFGFLDYGKKVSHKVLIKLLKELSTAAESRGTDATGISYVNDEGKIVTFKTPKPAHKVKLYFPKGTTSVIGHTRMTTQGSETKNYNNHPFEGRTNECSFALAHNGVLHNDKELRLTNNLPKTEIETDSYIAVQLLEQYENVDTTAVTEMAETVEGSFVFTILKDDNTIYLVKGSNPLTIYHYEDLGLYVYASTKEILATGLKKSGFKIKCDEVLVNNENIIRIDTDGEAWVSDFKEKEQFGCYRNRFDYSWYDYADCEDKPYEEECFEELKSLCSYCYGVDPEVIDDLQMMGYSYDEIEEMIMEMAGENI